MPSGKLLAFTGKKQLLLSQQNDIMFMFAIAMFSQQILIQTQMCCSFEWYVHWGRGRLKR